MTLNPVPADFLADLGMAVILELFVLSMLSAARSLWA